MGDGALTGAITGAIQGGMSGYSGYLKNGACFVAGTTVATATGLVAIEKIRAGDLVWAWDEETGDVALKPVVETYINETTELTHIFVDDKEIVYSLVFKLFNSPALGLHTIRVSTLWGTF